MRMSDWSSDVCSSALRPCAPQAPTPASTRRFPHHRHSRRCHSFHSPINQHQVSRPPGGQEAARGIPTEAPAPPTARTKDRKSLGKGKRVSVRVDVGGRRIIKKKNRTTIKTKKK